MDELNLVPNEKSIPALILILQPESSQIKAETASEKSHRSRPAIESTDLDRTHRSECRLWIAPLQATQEQLWETESVAAASPDCACAERARRKKFHLPLAPACRVAAPASST